MNVNTPAPGMEGHRVVQRLLRSLTLTEERELTCVEVYQLLDYLVDLERAEENVPGLLPKMSLHLRLCQDCGEEYEALMRLLRGDE